MSNTPLLSDYDESRAPWNDAMPRFVHKDYTVAYELHKDFDLIREEDDDDGESAIDDFTREHYSPIELIDYLHSLLQALTEKGHNVENYKSVMRECEGWSQMTAEII